ncbi:Retrovirus-related Pol polyprotein from transposon RE1 [Vitis vinifera]|uniref:Retrovirus-related Pol polyprotein from transposon RE1 n=1 Tax=Vitis vinifera TaxID=29760 RepID=A0A438HJ37_VITVI|nr:Retrovirus-related Pol polyprotein from transposon RE1 [Vitis vinifera]
MHSEFEMSMMGELNFFLGLQNKQLKEGTFINQAKYIRDLLKRFNMEEAKTMKTPMSSSIKLDMDDKGKSVHSTMYRGMIGSLLYLTASRPDIMYSGFDLKPKVSIFWGDFSLTARLKLGFSLISVRLGLRVGVCSLLFDFILLLDSFFSFPFIGWLQGKRRAPPRLKASALLSHLSLSRWRLAERRYDMTLFNSVEHYQQCNCDDFRADLPNSGAGFLFPGDLWAWRTSFVHIGLQAYEAKVWPTMPRFEPREIRRAEQQARVQGQMHLGAEEEAEIREMEDGLDHQRDFEQRGPELDISPPPQSEGIHAPHAPDHAPWMDISAQISSLGTRMEEFALQRFERIEERMDQQQATFEHLQQSIDHIESHQVFGAKKAQPVEAMANWFNRLRNRSTGCARLVEDRSREAKKFLSLPVAFSSGAEVTGSNPKGVAEGEIVSRSKGWPRPSTPLVLAVGAWVNAL